MITFKQFLHEEAKNDYFNRLLTSLNIKRLGKGAFGQVFQHPKFKDVVVKIFSESEDPRLARYLEWCLKNQSNPWVPKVIGIEKVDMPNHKGFDVQTQWFVFMEKLEPLSEKEFAKYTMQLTAVVPFDKHTQSIQLARQTRNMRKLTRADWKLISDHSTGDLKIMAARLAKISDKHLDVHGKNVMKRGTQLVFTDPTT